ncbi:MAG TPA: MATE family efflux transporter, partial [Pseudohongiella sp.]|nr:MATE family efflux transporter [Pseudohongiella sp.]
TREMRNASLVSAGLFFALSLWTVPAFGIAGLWSAFIAFVVLRAICLLWYLRRLRQSLLR